MGMTCSTERNCPRRGRAGRLMHGMPDSCEILVRLRGGEAVRHEIRIVFLREYRRIWGTRACDLFRYRPGRVRDLLAGVDNAFALMHITQQDRRSSLHIFILCANKLQFCDSFEKLAHTRGVTFLAPSDLLL